MLGVLALVLLLALMVVLLDDGDGGDEVATDGSTTASVLHAVAKGTLVSRHRRSGLDTTGSGPRGARRPATSTA